jgi:hypothetical protein
MLSVNICAVVASFQIVTQSTSQVKVMEIFDVTQTDPALLVTDNMGIQYTQEDQLLPNDSVTRLRHSSGPSLPSKGRRNSVQPSSLSGYSFCTPLFISRGM